MNWRLWLCASVIAARIAAQDGGAGALAVGVALAQQDKMREAAAVFERCVQQYPGSFEAKYNLALARIALSEYESALEVVNSIAPSTADEKAAVAYLAGKILLATNHLKEAQKELADAYARRPDEENYALDLAMVYIRSSTYLQATEVLQRALAAHPGSMDLRLEMAVTDVLAGRYSEGIGICRTLQERDPTLSVTRLVAAFSYCAKKDYKACEDESSAGLAAPHAYPYLYYLRARALWDSESSDRGQMLEDVSRAIQQMPKCSVCFVLRSRLLEASHDDDAAIADLKQAVATDAQADSAWYRLFLLYRKAQRPAEAADALKHCRSIHDDGLHQEVESFREQFLNSSSSKMSQ
jgi:thioredoxin-like negative regulator of GroEL